MIGLINDVLKWLFCGIVEKYENGMGICRSETEKQKIFTKLRVASSLVENNSFFMSSLVSKNLMFRSLASLLAKIVHFLRVYS